jgi:hypothetical protein
MFTFLGRFEELAGDLYPYRWLILAVAIAFTCLIVLVTVRLGWHRALWHHRALTALIAAPILGLAALVGTYTLPPLWQRSHLDEASPLVVTTAPVEGEQAGMLPESVADVFEPRVTRRGMFEGADDFHFGRGHALLIETTPGMFTLRFEEFSVRNGPDLFVYLTNDPENIDDAVTLGDLKATDGNHNYEVPARVDPTRYQYAIVWCREFAVLFATAKLETA